jgi:hypothetical protein
MKGYPEAFTRQAEACRAPLQRRERASFCLSGFACLSIFMAILERNALTTPGGTRLQTQALIAAIIRTSLTRMMSPILETCLFTLL